jgi:hypothetical protein
MRENYIEKSRKDIDAPLKDLHWQESILLRISETTEE